MVEQNSTLTINFLFVNKSQKNVSKIEENDKKEQFKKKKSIMKCLKKKVEYKNQIESKINNTENRKDMNSTMKFNIFLQCKEIRIKINTTNNTINKAK